MLLCVFQTDVLLFPLICIIFSGDASTLLVPCREALEMYDTSDYKQHQVLQWPDSLVLDPQTSRFSSDSFQQLRPNFKSRTKTSHVTDNEKYHCLACNRKYLRKKSLTRHLRYECGKQPLYLCPVQLCSYKAFYRIVLEKHIQTHMKK